MIVFQLCNMVARSIYNITFNTNTLSLYCGVQLVRKVRFIHRRKDSSIKWNQSRSPLKGDQADELTGCDEPKDTLEGP